MQIILLERIENLGRMGDVVRVKDGYARNYLLPRKKALRANAANRAYFETQRTRIEAENEVRRTEAEGVAAKLAGRSVVLIRQAGDSGQLYGSVSTRDIADALSNAEVKVARNQVVLDRPIKELGLLKVRIALHGEVDVEVEVNVARSEQEAELQAKGINVVAQQAQEDAEAKQDLVADIADANAENETDETDETEA